MTQAEMDTHAPPTPPAAKLTLPTLTMMLVGSMAGAGVSPCRGDSPRRRGRPVL